MKQQPFASPEEALRALQHHGVKGQKWGVVHEPDSGGGNGVGNSAAKIIRTGKDDGKTPAQVAEHNKQTKTYLAEAIKPAVPLSKEEAQAALAANRIKSAQKLLPSEPESSSGKNSVKEHWDNLSPNQKKALIWGGVAVGTYAALYAGGRHLEKQQLKVANVKSWEEVTRLAGKPIDAQQFHGLVGLSSGKTWAGTVPPGYMTATAFARPAFELPAGHTFYRLTTKAESGFKEATYATHSIDDFNRYVAGFRHEKGLTAEFHQVTWKSKVPIRVPDLTTVLGQMSEVLKEEGKTADPEYTMKAYQTVSGSTWRDVRGEKLMNKLKALGYGAVVDEMDAGVIGNTPLVFFDHEHATPKQSKPFTSEAIKKAEALLKELDNPPGRKL